MPATDRTPKYKRILLKLSGEALMGDAEDMWSLMQREGEAFGSQMKSPEAMEAFMAFTQKRAPNFG